MSANAQNLITLTDNNAYATVDTGSQAGMNFWSVDGNGASGQNQLMQQWFWYRTDTGLQKSIDSISAPVNSVTGNTLTTTYTSANNFSVAISYTLTGDGPGTGGSDIQEAIEIHNFTGSDLNFSFYEYSHFTLLGQNFGNTVNIGSSLASQQNGSSGIAEGVVSPDASAWEANTYQNGGLGSTLYDLTNTPNLTLNTNMTHAEGDVTWAYQWNFVVPHGATTDILKDKFLSISFVPEPSAVALISTGCAVLAIRRRRLTVKKG
jgi:hypothetical protein